MNNHDYLTALGFHPALHNDVHVGTISIWEKIVCCRGVWMVLKAARTVGRWEEVPPTGPFVIMRYEGVDCQVWEQSGVLL